MANSGFAKLTAGIHSAIQKSFGEDAEYFPRSGGSVSLVGVYNEQFIAVDPNTTQDIATQQPNFGIKRSDLSSDPVKGDRLQLRDRTFVIHDAQEDGEGWIILLLHEV